MCDGIMNPKSHYDRDTDIFYVSFSDEPSYAENIDDMLFIEIGWLSGLPTGFWIMDIRKWLLSTIDNG